MARAPGQPCAARRRRHAPPVVSPCAEASCCSRGQTIRHRYTRPQVSDGAPIRILRAITRLNIGGPAIHAILLTRDLNDGVDFQSVLVSGTPAAHEGNFADLAHANGVEPITVESLGREIS